MSISERVFFQPSDERQYHFPPDTRQHVFIRLDLNVPLSKEDGVTITSDKRLRAVVPTLKFLKEQGAKVLQRYRLFEIRYSL